WWYYTGNVKSASGRRFGFELTFFRRAVTRLRSWSPEVPGSNHASTASLQRLNSDSRYFRASALSWPVEDVYLAHLALTDVDGRNYLHGERLNRPGPGLAGVELDQLRIWNGNWEVRWHDDVQQLQGVTERFTLR